MRIAVIGSGHLGAALSAGWAAEGHQVIFGVRDPGASDAREILKSSQNMSAEAVSEAASKAERSLWQFLMEPWKKFSGTPPHKSKEKS